MIRLRGHSSGGGLVLGSASVLRAPHGIPLLPAHMVAQLSKTERNAAVEPMEVVLVATDYEAAASLSLPWARPVAIVAENDCAYVKDSPVPAVCGVAGLMQAVTDETIVLVDADSGVVLVDPDATVIATYQAEHDRIAPRRRVYLEYQHLPARTLDGREIRVMARVENLADVRTAVEQGADGLYVPPDCELVPADVDDDDQYDALASLAVEAAGKPITLAGDAVTVAMEALLRAAARADFTLAAPLELPAGEFSALRTHSHEVREELIAIDEPFGEIRLAGVLRDQAPQLEPLDAYFVSKLVVDCPALAGLTAVRNQQWLDTLVAGANGLLLPVELCLPAAEPERVAVALGLGVVGLIVEPAAVLSTKDAARVLDTTECRASLVDPGHNRP